MNGGIYTIISVSRFVCYILLLMKIRPKSPKIDHFEPFLAKNPKISENFKNIKKMVDKVFCPHLPNVQKKLTLDPRPPCRLKVI